MFCQKPEIFFAKKVLDPSYVVLESFLLLAPLIPFLKDANQNFPKPFWISFLRCVEKFSHRPAWFLFPKCCWISPKDSVFSFQEFPRWIPSRIQSVYFICHFNSSQNITSLFFFYLKYPLTQNIVEPSFHHHVIPFPKGFLFRSSFPFSYVSRILLITWLHSFLPYVCSSNPYGS